MRLSDGCSARALLYASVTQGGTDPDPAKFVNTSAVHGWVKIARCTLYSSVDSPPVHAPSTTTRAWKRTIGGPCPAGETNGVSYPSGCAFWVNRWTQTKHFVRNCAVPVPGWECPPAASKCWEQTQRLLGSQKLLPDEEVAALLMGGNFTCEMLGENQTCRSLIDRNLTEYHLR